MYSIFFLTIIFVVFFTIFYFIERAENKIYKAQKKEFGDYENWN